MKLLGIYFGQKSVGIVEETGKKITRSLQIPRVLFSETGVEEKVPDEVKIVALFNDEFRKAGISSGAVTISLSGKDLIIRTFEMPVLPKDELRDAVSFEAKKYIPFKIEELVYDYQIFFDKTTRKNLVLLVGIKKDILNKYLAIFNQLNRTVSSIEYSAFTVIRLLKSAGVPQQGVIAIVSSDISGEDEINFIVLHNGFPLFSRDIIISEEAEPHLVGESTTSGNILEKLKAELRISLDFYKRKFPSKGIEKIFFIAPDEFRLEMESFLKERGLPSRFVDIKKQIGVSAPFSLSIAKAYGAAMSKVVSTSIKIDLVAAKARIKSAKEMDEAGKKREVAWWRGMQLDPRIIFFSVLICAIVFGIGMYQRFPVQQEVSELIRKRPQVASVTVDASYDQITTVNTEFKNKITTLSTMLNKQHILTEQFDSLPRLLPDGVWLTDVSFVNDESGKKISLVLSGGVYLKNSVKELQTVNLLLANLKEDPHFSKPFKTFTIITVDQRIIDNFPLNVFTITCAN